MLRALFSVVALSLTAGCITVEAPANPSSDERSSDDAKTSKTESGTGESKGDGATSGGDAPAPAPVAAAATTRFGVAGQWSDTWNPPVAGPANVDAVVVGNWLLRDGFTDTHKAKLDTILAHDRTPYLFGYILTDMTKKGLGEDADCDGDPSRLLCQKGADWVRDHIEGDIVPAYRAAATQIGASAGAKEVLIHIEPDYLQFSEKAQVHPLTHDESNGFMNKILAAIKEGCASCKVVADFSPWFTSTKTAWATKAADFYEGWDRSMLKYVGLTGKQFTYTEGKVDNYTYAEIAQELKLPLVVIDAYTFGGASIDVDRSWLDSSKLPKMKEMGIAYVFLSQQGDVAGYDAFLASRATP